MVRKARKDLRQLVHSLQLEGFEVRWTSRGHLVVGRVGRVVTVFSGSPSDWRSFHNSMADLRRAGYAGLKRRSA